MRTSRTSLTTLAMTVALGLVPAGPTLNALAGSPQEQAAQSGSAKESSDLYQLARKKPLERELNGDEPHFYSLSIPKGHHVYLLLNQRSIDVLIRVFGPDNRLLAEVNDQHNDTEVEQFSLIGDYSTGSYRLEVLSATKAATGHYEVIVDVLDPSTKEGTTRIAAENAYAAGERLRQLGKAESDRKAAEKYQEALIAWRGVGDVLREGKASYSAATIKYRLNDYPSAVEYFREALRLYRAAGYQRGEAVSLFALARSYWAVGQIKKALDADEQALQIFVAMGELRMQASSLTDIGGLCADTGELEKAIGYIQRALPIIRQIKDRFWEGTALNSLGVVCERLGEHQKALDYYAQSLLAFDASGERGDRPLVLGNIGEIYRLMGDPPKALKYLNEALDELRSTGYATNEPDILSNIGRTYAGLGEHQKALEYLNRALTISRSTGDRLAEAITIHKIGEVQDNSGNFAKALDNYTQAVLIFRAVEDRQREADTIRSIGDVYHSLGDLEKAWNYYAQALPLQRTIGDRKAEAATLFGMARVDRDRGKLFDARGHIEKALNIVESLRGKVAAQELRASYVASRQHYYELNIDLLMRLHQRDKTAGFAAEALQASERARARGLLEILNEARVRIREGVDPLLLQRERGLQNLVNAKAELLTRLLSAKQSNEQAEATKKELDSIIAEYQDVQTQIRKNSPRYAALIQPQTLGLKEIQQQVLDEDTLLLEYSLGKDRSYLWAVTPSSNTSFELPGRAEIETAARRFYELLIAGDKRESRSQTKLAAAQLSRIVLGPAAALLEKKRLLIVSEGTLQYVPFAALPVPLPADGSRVADAGTGNEQRPLIVDHEIINLPSVSALAVLRQEVTGRQRGSKAVAVIADPVLRSDDSRVNPAHAKVHKPANEAVNALSIQRHAKEDLLRSAKESGIVFERLRYTRLEAEAIAALAPKQDTLKALDFEASRARAMSSDLSRYRIVHFATHGLINSQHPELSGVVLSLVDEQGNPQDGFLRLHDVYNLKLGADMVVLSACQTALGKDVKGEGLMGLTRGFMYAGAARVVASLWDVKDEATADLMKRFYQGIYQKELRPAAALRAAQVEMWKDKRWEAPFYWAAFVLQGEWR